MKSYATTVKTTTTVFQENAQDTNLKSKSSNFKRENVYQKLKQRGDYKKITQTNWTMLKPLKIQQSQTLFPPQAKETTKMIQTWMTQVKLI